MARGLLPVGRPDRDVQNFRYLMQRRFMKVVTPEDVDQMVRTGIDRAKAGDHQWAALIFPWIFGKQPKSDDDSSSDVTVGGNLNIVMNELSIEQLEALAALRSRAAYHTIDIEDVRSILPEPAPGDRE